MSVFFAYDITTHTCPHDLLNNHYTINALAHLLQQLGGVALQSRIATLAMLRVAELQCTEETTHVNTAQRPTEADGVIFIGSYVSFKLVVSSRCTPATSLRSL